MGSSDRIHSFFFNLSQICSSAFASDEWRVNLAAGLDFNLSVYATRDYRRFLPAHSQFLNGLCQLSIQSINNSIGQFLSSALVTAEVISETTFYSRIKSLVQQSKLSAPAMFSRLLNLLRAINHGNAVVSAYGTNFEYIVPTRDPYSNVAITRAVVYENNCSCGLDATCTIPASFISNSSQMLQIKGFKMGCTPSESFLASTLECFYDPTCINLIQEHANYINWTGVTKTPIPLVPTGSHFPINTTVGHLTKALFVEDWTTAINYSSYYEQCAPILCSYTYIQQVNSVYTVTLISGIYGGLTVVLKLICPWLVRLGAKMHTHRKSRSHVAQSERSIDTTITAAISTASDSTKTRNISCDVELISMAPANEYAFSLERP